MLLKITMDKCDSNLEELRDKDGFIDLTNFKFKEKSKELRGNQKRIKNWVKFKDCEGLVKGEFYFDKPNNGVYAEVIASFMARHFNLEAACYSLVKLKDEEGKIIDYLGGQKDIEDRIIRTVGDAKEKFSDDSLRILRAIRFATILDFQLSDEIEQAIFETKGFVRELSYQRKKEEVVKIFNSPNRDKGIQLLLKFGLDQELEIEHLEDVIGRDMDSSLVVWSQLEVSPKYPFHKNEMEMIHHIQKAMELNNLDPMALYTYGLYVNSCAGKMKDVDVKKITESYANLVIKSRDEIAITSLQIMELLHRGSGKYLKEIYDDVEREILYRRLPNELDSISQYIVEHYA